MSETLLIQGLNMNAVNSFIWASAVLAKVGVIALIITTVIGLATLVLSILGE